MPPAIIEVKSSEQQTKRVERQQSEITRLADYLRTDRTTIRDYEVTRRESTIEYIAHCSELNKLLQEATTTGFGFSEVERGLYYYVEMQEKKARFQSIIGSLPHPPIVCFLNMFRQSNIGYYPFTLSIEDPETVFKFYDGQSRIFVLIDPDVIRSKIQAHGLTVEFEEDDEWFLSITAGPNDNSSRNQLGAMKVGRHFFNRIPFEFISLDWLIEETIDGFNNPPTEVLRDRQHS